MSDIERLPRFKQHAIWLDDTRPNPDPRFYDVTCRCFSEMRQALGRIQTEGGQVQVVDFDYMLIDFKDPNWEYTKNGADCAELLISMAMDASPVPLLSEDCTYSTHSSDAKCNTRIKERIEMMLSIMKEMK